MHDIDTIPMTPDFFDCWKAAGTHLSRQVDSGIRSWLRAHPYPPFREHLSFRLGNQLFFVRLEDVDARVEGPGTIAGLFAAARSAQGHPVIMPMQRTIRDG